MLPATLPPTIVGANIIQQVCRHARGSFQHSYSFTSPSGRHDKLAASMLNFVGGFSLLTTGSVTDTYA